MRRSVTIADPLHSWIQKIRASYLNEQEMDLSYTHALNYYLALGVGMAALKLEGEKLEEFADEMLRTEDIYAASIQDEADNLWLAQELPKIMQKIREEEIENKKNRGEKNGKN